MDAEKKAEMNAGKKAEMNVGIKSRQDAEKLMLLMLNPLRQFYSRDRAFVKVGETSAHFPDKSAWIEGFSRPLWALVPFWAGGGGDTGFEEIYREGLVAGTNPESDEYWGKCTDYDQRFVEMAAVGYAMLFAPGQIWEPLSEEEKARAADWLNEINRNRCWDCNWRFFQVIVNIALKKRKMPYSRKILQESLDFIEECYAGGGWYRDGVDGQTDYYIPFAMHFYGLIYAAVMKEEDAERCEAYIERALQFGKDFVYWFSEDGSALPYGRSLTYRFAQSAFYSACVMAHIEPLPMPVMKGIIVRNLEYWMKQPVFDNVGILTIGYCYANLQMSESYNSPQSPYWAMKTFAILALDENEPFWNCEAARLPVLQKQKLLKGAGMLIQRRKNGNVVAFPGGNTHPHEHGHMEEKYGKFAYSTKYGFSIMRSDQNLAEAAPDSVCSFRVHGHIFVRGQAENIQVYEDMVVSDWSPVEGIRVHSEIIPTQNGHLRRHLVESEAACEAYDAGFAVPMEEADGCSVHILCGKGRVEMMKPDPNTNLIHSKTLIPTAVYCIEIGKSVLETEIRYE